VISQSASVYTATNHVAIELKMSSMLWICHCYSPLLAHNFM